MFGRPIPQDIIESVASRFAIGVPGQSSIPTRNTPSIFFPTAKAASVLTV